MKTHRPRAKCFLFIAVAVLIALALNPASTLASMGASAGLSSDASLAPKALFGQMAATSDAPIATKLEAEALSRSAKNSVITDAAASGGSVVLMWANGSLTGTYTGSIGSLSARARGDQCRGSAPHMRVLVDNVVAIDAMVANSSYADYSANLSAANTTHSITLTFDNDYYVAGVCDRNLIADSLTFYSSSTATPTLTATPLLTSTAIPTATRTSTPAATATATPVTQSFRFLSWADAKVALYSHMSNLSNQAKGLNARFSLFIGDFYDLGYDQSKMGQWAASMNGGNNNGTTASLFPIRGNHENEIANSAANWQAYFNTAGVANAVGVGNYVELSPDLTYSFDYRNARFIQIDDPGDASLITNAQLSWVDGRVTDAERSGSGIAHVFLFFHGPLVSTGLGHPGLTVPSAIASLINRHPIIASTFHGHEHNLSYVHLDSSVSPLITRPIEMFVTGSIAAGPTGCAVSSYTTAWCQSVFGFATVDVSGSLITVSYYQEGNSQPIKTIQFSH